MSNEQEVSTWTVWLLWWIENIWNRVLRRGMFWCAEHMTGTYKPRLRPISSPASVDILRESAEIYRTLAIVRPEQYTARVEVIADLLLAATTLEASLS